MLSESAPAVSSLLLMSFLDQFIKKIHPCLDSDFSVTNFHFDKITLNKFVTVWHTKNRPFFENIIKCIFGSFPFWNDDYWMYKPNGTWLNPMVSCCEVASQNFIETGDLRKNRNDYHYFINQIDILNLNFCSINNKCGLWSF